MIQMFTRETVAYGKLRQGLKSKRQYKCLQNPIGADQKPTTQEQGGLLEL